MSSSKDEVNAITIASVILTLIVPVLFLICVNYYDDIHYWIIFRGHEREIITIYQKLIDELEQKRKKFD
jgi:hypothetical protein